MDILEESFPDKKLVDSYTLYTIEPEIEILSITDERLKVLAEELSNETSRAILNCIFEGKRTAGEISGTLNMSLPLVGYHIERLLKTNIIRISGIELNSKRREKKVYDAKKVAIIIQLNPNDPDLRRRLRRLFILSASVATIGIVSVIWQVVSLQNQLQIVITNPEDLMTPFRHYVPVILSGIGVATSAILAWAIRWLKRNK